MGLKDVVISCAKCRQPVQALTWQDKLMTRAFIARCHGEREVTIISHLQILESSFIEGGVAFAQ